MKPAVRVVNLKKSYGEVESLRGVDFTTCEGECFGIIGPDGAGKTTLLRILATLLSPSSGTAEVAGRDAVKDYKDIRKKVGYMPGRFSLYQDLTVEENIAFFATVFGATVTESYGRIKDIYHQIEPFADRKAGDLSGGMKQKLALCCALVHKPEILLLDEPTTGVDPVSRNEFWDVLNRLQRQGITIIVTTPYMDEATRCDRIALIREGRFLQTDTPEHIIRQFDQTLWAVSGTHMFRLLAELRAHPQVTSSYAFGDAHHVTVDNRLTTGDLAAYLAAKGHDGVEIKPIRASIEDCYMQSAQYGSEL
ncbi:MAG: ABC transporter ATP-binding protein [Mediterranea sp.]|jgi:ABC-type multidrug transport system ATPase subunit|nr:ABC transporter ATP-binding protein [Mediterranea sp.]